MTVHIVMSLGRRQDHIEGVYSTKDAAEAYVEELNQNGFVAIILTYEVRNG